MHVSKYKFSIRQKLKLYNAYENQQLILIPQTFFYCCKQGGGAQNIHTGKGLIAAWMNYPQEKEVMQSILIRKRFTAGIAS